MKNSVNNIVRILYTLFTIVYIIIFFTVIIPIYKEEILYLKIVSILLLIGMPTGVFLWWREKFKK